MPSPGRKRRFVLAAGAGVFQRLVQIASTLVLMPLLLHVLGVARFGIWGSASSLAWFSGLVDIGIGTALVTLIARAVAAGRPEEARAHLSGALFFGSAISLVMLGALAIWIQVAGFGGSAPIMIAIAGLALNVPLNSANNTWMALQKGYISGLWELMQTLLTLGGVLAASGITHDVRVYVAIVYGALVVSNAGSLLHLLAVHPELRPHRLPPAGEVKQVLHEGFLLFVLNLAGGLSFLLDNVLALRLLGPTAAAQMTVALRICMTGLGFLLVISQPMWPVFVEAAEKGDRRWIRKNLLQGMALLTGLSVAGSAVLLVFGEKLLRLWLHADLGIGVPLLWAIAAWGAAQALVRVPHLMLNGLSILGYQVTTTIVATASALMLKWPLVFNAGVGGILWGTSLTVYLVVIPAFMVKLAAWDGTRELVPAEPELPNLPPII